MALNLYKPGQGYWTRLLTAIGVGVLVVAGAMWLAQKVNATGWSIDTKMAVSVQAQALPSNQNQALNVLGIVAAKAVLPGREAEVLQVDKIAADKPAATSKLLVGDIINDVKVAPDGTGAELSITRPRVITIYVSTGLGLLIVGGFGLMLYKFTGTSPRTCDFMIDTEGEMKKVAWPDRKEVIGSTLVVIWCMILFATLLFASDFIFSWFFRTIHVLDV